ncbi:MAG: GlsB/YeaQ/YmgE family stress response membrane protein, partial [bacterium]|nr:GlsB/YeaQ/YmgE family stress response membrane protein [bacterium]
NVIAWIVFGALAGFIADFIDKSVALSWPERIIVGIIGAFVGGMLANLITTGSLSISGSNDFDIMSVLLAVIGALISIFIYKKVRKA